MVVGSKDNGHCRFLLVFFKLYQATHTKHILKKTIIHGAVAEFLTVQSWDFFESMREVFGEKRCLQCLQSNFHCSCNVSKL